MDDFFGVNSALEANDAFRALKALLEDLGLEESLEKQQPPSTRMEVLGVWFDTNKMTREVTAERLH